PRRTEIARRYDIPANLAFPDLDSAFASESFDAAVIATPAPTHIPIAIRLAALGTHLLIEKPLSLTTDAIGDPVELIREKPLTVAVGYVHLAHPAVEAMKEALDSGRFGRVLQIRSASRQAFATLRPAYRDVYFAKAELGGGAINDIITHFFNVGA